MRRAWREFRAGWHEARWGGRVVIALLPFAFGGALLIEIARGNVPQRVVAAIVSFACGIAFGFLFAALFRAYWGVLCQELPSVRERWRRRTTSPCFAGAKGGEAGSDAKGCVTANGHA